MPERKHCSRPLTDLTHFWLDLGVHVFHVSPVFLSASSSFWSLLALYRSSSVYPGLVYIQQPYFPNFSNLEQCCLYTFINHFHFDSVFKVQNKTRQYFSCFAWIILTMHACTNLFKILQDSSNLCKTQHVLYFLNAWGSMICHSLRSYHNISPPDPWKWKWAL